MKKLLIFLCAAALITVAIFAKKFIIANKLKDNPKLIVIEERETVPLLKLPKGVKIEANKEYYYKHTINRLYTSKGLFSYKVTDDTVSSTLNTKKS